MGRKRDIPMNTPVAKKSRSSTPDEDDDKVANAVGADDTSVHQSIISPSIYSTSSVEPVTSASEELADDASESRKFDRAEMMHQSLVISEVALKLEQ